MVNAYKVFMDSAEGKRKENISVLGGVFFESFASLISLGNFALKLSVLYANVQIIRLKQFNWGSSIYTSSRSIITC